MSRTPNTQCTSCKKPLYRRPSYLLPQPYCQPCWGIKQRKTLECVICESHFFQKDRKAKTCSDACFQVLWKQRLSEKNRPRKNGNPTTTQHLKKWLILERGAKCEVCGLSEWMGKPINLTLDHIDGNNKNNARENLRILCWNCHSQTDTFCAKNVKRFSTETLNGVCVDVDPATKHAILHEYVPRSMGIQGLADKYELTPSIVKRILKNK